MPYQTIADLPDPVKTALPKHGQEIYAATFNSAFEAHKGEADQEKAAHQLAWGAVKKSYEQDNDGKWVEKAKEAEPLPPLRPFERQEHITEFFQAGEVQTLGDGDYKIEFLAHGTTADGKRHYPKSALESAVGRGVFDNAKMYLNHSDTVADNRRGHRDLREWAATIKPGTVQVVEGNLQAVCHAHLPEARAILDDPVAKAAVGLSHDSFVRTSTKEIDKKQIQQIEAIEACNSVDFVPAGNARGHVLEAAPIEGVIEVEMKDLTLADLKKERPDLCAALAKEALASEDETAEEKKAKEALPMPTPAVVPVAPVAPPAEDPRVAEALKVAAEAKAESAALRQEARQRDTVDLVSRAVEAQPNLSAVAKSRVIESFKGHIVAADQIAATVKEACEKEEAYCLTLLREAGFGTQVRGTGETAATAGDIEAGAAFVKESRRQAEAEGMNGDDLKRYFGE